MVSISVTPSASPSSKPSPTRSWATITSITTETVHPTYLFTLTESETVSRSVTSSAFAESSQTSRSAVDTHAIVETSSTTLDTPVTFTGSSIIMTSVMDVPLSTMSPSDPLAHLSGFNSLENAQSTSTYFEQPEATTSSTSSTSISITSASSSTAAASISPVISPFIGTVTGTISPDNSTSSTTTPFIGTVSSKVSPYKSPTSSNATESSPFFNTKDDKAIKPAVIVGIVIGVSALIMFALAGCFILRRRRQKIMKKQKIIGAQIKRPSFRSSLGLGYKTLHIRRAATPTTTRTIRTPTLPVIPEEAHTVPACSNDPFTHAHSNPDLSMDSLYLRSERLHRASYAQPGLTSGSPTDHSPLEINVCPPSRGVSGYSHTSWEDASVEADIVDFYATGARPGSSSLPHEHEHDGFTLAPSNAKYLEACMLRDSLRSDPFDLEAPSVSNPPGSPPVPPVPTEWGTKF